jgi:hypothetical protein
MNAGGGPSTEASEFRKRRGVLRNFTGPSVENYWFDTSSARAYITPPLEPVGPASEGRTIEKTDLP